MKYGKDLYKRTFLIVFSMIIELLFPAKKHTFALKILLLAYCRNKKST